MFDYCSDRSFLILVNFGSREVMAAALLPGCSYAATNWMQVAVAAEAWWVDLRVTWVCIHDLTWHQNELKVD